MLLLKKKKHKHKKKKVHISDLKHKFKNYADLNWRLKGKVRKLYQDGWDPVLDEEARIGVYDGPKKEEIKRQFHSELYKRFPEGQKVLLAKVRKKCLPFKTWEPVISTRSIIWRIPEYAGTEFEEYWRTDDQVSFETLGYYIKESYPPTWYLASGYGGKDYEKIQMMVNGEPEDYIDYKTVLNSTKEENRKHEFVLINYAMTGNPNLTVKIKGAVEAAVEEREDLKKRLGLLHCDTLTPLSGYSEWVKEHGECAPWEYLKNNIDSGGKIFDAALMHKLHGAKLIYIFENARFDPRSLNCCIITRYS